MFIKIKEKKRLFLSGMKKKLSGLLISREALSLIWVMIIILLVALVVIKDKKIAENKSASCRGCSPVIVQPVTVSAYDLIESASAAKATHWQSFGDNFSSLSYLDESKSDMFFDDRVTALTFPPVYSWEKRFDCENINCFSAKDFFIPVRIFPPDYKFGELLDSKVSALPSPLPAELEGREIVSFSINRLNLRQVVSFVVKEGREERGLVYFLDENTYTPIIYGNSGAEILTSWGVTGGSIVAGGEDNDFLILYIGYEGKAWHYKDGVLTDVSRFFGLRVASGGFYPLIIKQGRGNQSVWYILSLSRNKFKLVKLWQNGTGQMQGGIDLSSQIEDRIKLTGGRLAAIRSGVERGAIDFILEFSPNSFSLWTFRDLGFDNSRLRTAVSKNVDANNLSIFRAAIRSIGLAGQGRGGGYEQSFPSRNFKIYLGDNPKNLFLIDPGQTIKFPGYERQLFWKIEFLPEESSEYSPWFDHLNDLQYLVASEVIF